MTEWLVSGQLTQDQVSHLRQNTENLTKEQSQAYLEGIKKYMSGVSGVKKVLIHS